MAPGWKNVVVSYSGNYESGKPEIGNGTIIKYFAKSTKTGSFYIKPIQISPDLTVSANEIYNGENATITVTINNKTTGKVTINIDGEDEVIEMNEGKATFTTPALKSGKHNFTIAFEGDEYFLAESKNVTVKVKDNLRIELINDANQYKNGYYTFKVVNDADGTPASGINVTLITGDGVMGAFLALTDADGIASFKTAKLQEYRLNGNLEYDFNVGKHQVRVSVNENGLTSNELVCNLTVTPANIKITINPYEEYYGSDKKLNITVTNVDGEMLPGTVLKVLIAASSSDYNYVSTDENGIAQIGVSRFYKGTYNITVSNNDTVNIINSTEKGNFTIKPLDTKFSVNASDIFVGENATIKVSIDEGFSGIVTITITDGQAIIPITKGYDEYNIAGLKADEYSYVVSYLGDGGYTEGNSTVTFNVNRKSPNFKIEIANVEENAPITVKVTADKSFTGKVTVKVNGIDVLVDIVEGAGANSTTGIVLPVKVGYDANLSFDGNDMFTEGQAKTTFNVSEKSASGNGSEDNKTNNTVPVKIVANDLSVYYNDGKKYTVTVYGTDGKVASKTQVIFKINGKKVGSAITDAKGIASLKITQIPKTYKITAEALGANITKTLKVNQVLKLQKVKVKRSAQKLVIKVTLKQGKKALKNKKITLKFKGKKYIKKTDKKGVAKFTIKKSVLKKLKRGKKITYTATYIKNTVKRTVKIK